jgi:ABC-type bacteriocin/lantibiotic exporter with double-glycine peptidase domain
MVLGYYGIHTSEEKLARLSGASRKRGTTAEGLLRAAHALKFQGFLKDHATIGDLRVYVQRRKIPVIVDWFSGTEGHYSPVVDVRENVIRLQDPDIGRVRTLDLATFQRIWFDFPGNAIWSPRNLILRRMIVMHPKGWSVIKGR